MFFTSNSKLFLLRLFFFYHESSDIDEKIRQKIIDSVTVSMKSNVYIQQDPNWKLEPSKQIPNRLKLEHVS